jgi:DNA-binding CsgD family transcriptional regulator
MGSYVELVQAAYAFHRDDEAWVDALVNELEALFGASSVAYVVQPEKLGRERVGAIAARGLWAPTIEQHVAQISAFSPEFMRLSYAGGPFVDLASERAALDSSQTAQGIIDGWKTNAPSMWDGVDIIGVYGGSLAGGCMFCMLVPRGPLASRTRWAMRRVAVHVAAAYRLRQANGRDPDALLDERGRVLEGALGSDVSPESLVGAAETLRRSEDMARSDPESAIAVWQGLFAGRWSLLASVDRGGRRHLVLRRNEIEEARGDRPIARRVASVVALAARGHSNKLIAYELGLPISTVASDLRAALSRLGLSRMELVRIGGNCGGET